ncbi:hypothetical protein CALVIDRAFT_44890 [Calocera viscosa TUFC12733]|uniref:Pal1-domain-containing protein n=1 Tax=Calocera viscosa (strain TUFC12733) TaxID=1330018 RepID=A0A167P408_CALVF|nr:hypothetical protein CALVIDRAFT_44890 [Calocera viscosa TUFC12733]
MTSSSTGRGSKKEKKASMHADIIDMMDYSGNGRFHHDGPFDAVARSRNVHPSRAPMGVFDYDTLLPTSGGGGPYPTSAAIAAVAAPPQRPLHTRARSSATGAVAPSVAINPAFIQSPVVPDKKKNAVAEAWGIADPEPFEEFSAGGTAGNNGYSAHVSPVSASAPSGSASRTAYNDYWNEGDAARNASRNARRTRTLPPPQQIMLPGSNFDPNAYRDIQEDSPGSDDKAYSPISPTAYPGTSPPRFKRTKSLMQRIRTMRDNPNVPVGAPDPDGVDPVSPFDVQYSASPSLDEPRPILYGADREGMQNSYSTASFERERENRSNGKKSGMSLFNRLARSPRQRDISASPPVSPTEENGGFVLIQSPRERPRHKALPSLPPDIRSPPVSGSKGYEKESYFDGAYPSASNGVPPGSPMTPGGHQLGRKRSLLSKMKGVTRN